MKEKGVICSNYYFNALFWFYFDCVELIKVLISLLFYTFVVFEKEKKSMTEVQKKEYGTVLRK